MLAITTTRRPRLPGDRRFHTLLLALAASSCGDWLYNVALLVFVYARTGSATWVAVTTAARVLPVVVLGPLGGVLADRCDRRRLLIVSALIRAGLMLALAAVASTRLPVALAPLIAAAATAASIVEAPSVAATTARLVAADELQRATAWRAGIGQAAIVAGPALGALVLAVSSPAVAIVLNALTFVVAALAIGALPPGDAFRSPPRVQDAARPSVLADLRDGARALSGAPTAIRLIAADVTCSAVYGLLTVTLVIVSRRVGAGDGGYGLLLGAFGAGGVIGAIVLGRLQSGAHWRRPLTAGLALVALAIAGLGIAPVLPVALALAFAGGGGMVVGEILADTALPRMLDEAVLARAYGLAFPASIAGIVIGSLVAGPLVGLLGASGALIVAGWSVAVVGALLVGRPLQPPVRTDVAGTAA
jgi:MFS family permease